MNNFFTIKGENTLNIEEKGLPDSKLAISFDNAATILKMLNGLNIGKSPKPDLVNVKMLKKLSKPVAPVLSIMIKMSDETGRQPSKWKEASIGAIY